MEWMVATILGAAAGWIAGLIVKVSGGRQVAWFVVVGMAGAVAGGALSRPFLGENTGASGFNLLALAAALAGAVVLLGALLIARRSLRG